MRRVERIHNLLLELENNKTESLLSFWKRYFEVDNIIDIYDRLIFLKKEFNMFELELKELKLDKNTQFINTLEALNVIATFPNLNNNLAHHHFMQEQNLNVIYGSLDIFKSFADASHINIIFEEDIEKNELDDFKNFLVSTIKTIDSSNMKNEDKTFFLEFFTDFEKALTLYKINGLEAFVDMIRKNLCKLKLLNDIESNKKYDIYTNNVKKVIGIVFNWGIKYIKQKTLSFFETETIKFLEENLEEWSQLSSYNENNKENEIIDGDIED